MEISLDRAACHKNREEKVACEAGRGRRPPAEGCGQGPHGLATCMGVFVGGGSTRSCTSQRPDPPGLGWLHFLVALLSCLKAPSPGDTGCVLAAPTPHCTPGLGEMGTQNEGRWKCLSIQENRVHASQVLEAKQLHRPSKTRKEGTPISSGRGELLFGVETTTTCTIPVKNSQVPGGSRKDSVWNTHTQLHVALGSRARFPVVLTPWSFPEPQKGINLWLLAHQQREVRREGWVLAQVMDGLDTHFSCIC